MLGSETDGTFTQPVKEGITRSAAPFSTHRQRSIQSNLTNIFRDEHTGMSAKVVEQLLTLALEEPDLVMERAATMLAASWTHNSMSLEKYKAVITPLRT